MVLIIGTTKKGPLICGNSHSLNQAKGGYGKFQRGVNLDQIEEREMAAAMPSEDGLLYYILYYTLYYTILYYTILYYTIV